MLPDVDVQLVEYDFRSGYYRAPEAPSGWLPERRLTPDRRVRPPLPLHADMRKFYRRQSDREALAYLGEGVA